MFYKIKTQEILLSALRVSSCFSETRLPSLAMMLRHTLSTQRTCFKKWILSTQWLFPKKSRKQLRASSSRLRMTLQTQTTKTTRSTESSDTSWDGTHLSYNSGNSPRLKRLLKTKCTKRICTTSPERPDVTFAKMSSTKSKTLAVWNSLRKTLLNTLTFWTTSVRFKSKTKLHASNFKMSLSITRNLTWTQSPKRWARPSQLRETARKLEDCWQLSLATTSNSKTTAISHKHNLCTRDSLGLEG